MTAIEHGTPPLVVAPARCRCLRCTTPQPEGTPVVLLATYKGSDFYACCGCAGQIEGGQP